MSNASIASPGSVAEGLVSPRSDGSDTALARYDFLAACCVVFLAPLNILRIPAFYFTASDGFACLCFGLMLLNRRVDLRVLGPGTGYWTVGLAMLIGALLVSSVLADVVDRGLILAVQYLFAYLVLPIILLNRPWHQTIILMKLFVAIIAVMVLHGIYVMDVLGERHTTFVSGSGRLMGFVERDNECGSLIALTIPLVLTLVLMRAMSLWLAILLVPLLAYGIMLTGSNTALYAMLYTLGIFFLATLTIQRAIIGAIVVAGLLHAATLSGVRERLPAVFQKRVLAGLESGNLEAAGTFVERMHLIREAVSLASNSLWYGYGADRYREISQWRTPVHNLYLLLWTEGGIPALAGFALMLVGALVTLVIAGRQRHSGPMVVSGLATVSLVAALANAVPHIYGRFWAVPLVLSMAPAIALLRFGPMPPWLVRGRRNRNRI